MTWKEQKAAYIVYVGLNIIPASVSNSSSCFTNELTQKRLNA